jgi:thioesterase domain-containing protein
VRLLARIEKELGRRLPLAALFRGSTIATLAAALRASPGTQGSRRSGPEPPLSLIQEGDGRPSFWFHPLGGRALCYADLARQLPGLALYGVESDRRPAATLADLAERYAEAILRQSGGPYVLGGWSFGGLLAWETASRLQEQGAEVALVALIDSRPPEGSAQPAVPDGAALDALLRAEVVGAAGLSPPELSAYHDTMRAHLDALRGYRLRPLACPVTLFVAAERPAGEREDRAALWRPFAAGGFQVEPVPGDHFSILREPAVVLLAERLRQRLAGLGALRGRLRDLGGQRDDLDPACPLVAPESSGEGQSVDARKDKIHQDQPGRLTSDDPKRI